MWRLLMCTHIHELSAASVGPLLGSRNLRTSHVVQEVATHVAIRCHRSVHILSELHHQRREEFRPPCQNSSRKHLLPQACRLVHQLVTFLHSTNRRERRGQGQHARNSSWVLRTQRLDGCSQVQCSCCHVRAVLEVDFQPELTQRAGESCDTCLWRYRGRIRSGYALQPTP